MDFEEFDVVKSEKAKALRRCLWALFWFGYYFSDVSLAVDVVSGFLHRQLKVLTTPFSAFVFGNGIVLVIFVLSGGGKDCQTWDDGDSEGNAVFRHACEGYESHRNSSPPEAEDSPKGTGTEKPMVFFSSAEEVKEMMTVSDIYVDVHEIPATVKETATESGSRPQEDEIGLLISRNGVSETDGPIPPSEGSLFNKRVLGRNNSEVISAKLASPSGPSRWATDNGRSKKIPNVQVDDERGTSPWPSTVDDLSNEEFNLKVERYIARKRLLLWEEMLAERCRIHEKSSRPDYGIIMINTEE